MRNLIEVSAFTAPVVVPENGEPVAAEQRDPAAQAFANRTRYLKDATDVLQNRFDAQGRVVFPSAIQVTKHLGSTKATPNTASGVAAWERGGGYDPDFLMAMIPPQWESRTNRGRLHWDLTDALGAAAIEIVELRAVVQPGAARATATDRMRLHFFSSEFDGGAWGSTLIDEETSDATASEQEIVLTLAAPMIIDTGKIYTIEVQGGVDAASSADRAMRATVVYNAIGHAI